MGVINFSLILLFCPLKQSMSRRQTWRLDGLLTDDDHCAVANISHHAHLLIFHTLSLLTKFHILLMFFKMCRDMLFLLDIYTKKLLHAALLKKNSRHGFGYIKENNSKYITAL